MSTSSARLQRASVDLFWLPWGAGAVPCVRWSGHVFEALVSRYERRGALDLYHSALEVHLDGEPFVIEMAPAWGGKEADRGVVCEGPVKAAKPAWGA